MKQTDTDNADVGLVAVGESDVYAQAYELFDEIEESMEDKDAAVVSEILSLAETNYERDPRKWDRLLNRLLSVLNNLSVEAEDGYDSLDDGEEDQADRSKHGQLTSILEDAEGL